MRFNWSYKAAWHLKGNPKGGVVKRTFEMNVGFDTDRGQTINDVRQAFIKSDLLGALDNAITILKNDPNATIDITGIASQKGGEDYNKKLAKKRTEATKAFILEYAKEIYNGLNLDEDRLVTTNGGVSDKGKGDEGDKDHKQDRAVYIEVVR